MPTTESSSILNQLFGCCLGWKRGASIQGDNNGARDEDGNHVDERTPLISGETNDAISNSNTARGKVQSGVKTDDKPALYVKRNVDTARLKAIRDKANDAFFHIDHSQLLPSSSSSRPMNANASQHGRGQKREYVKESALYQSLVSESDKAERLYKAALISPAHSEGRPFAIDGIDDGEEVIKADKINNQMSDSAIQGGPPLGLVRQMGVSIREAIPGKKETGKEQGNPALVRQLSSSPRESPSNLHKGANLSMSRHKMEHHPSLHSLRTLRLSVASNISPSLSSKIESTDEEDWNQRGRTRSKRGLAWMDVGQSRDITQRPELNQLFNNVKDAKEGEEVDKVKAITDSTGEEVPNALRLSANHNEVTNKILNRLKATSPVTAETFDGNHDST